jgi:hypothetical protein
VAAGLVDRAVVFGAELAAQPAPPLLLRIPPPGGKQHDHHDDRGDHEQGVHRVLL